VYAAGMSLSGARVLLRQDPAAAEQAIDAIRAALNTTIRDLRTFLEGIEPEPPPHSAFSAGVRSILALLQGVRPIDTTLKIDDTLAEQLPARVRLHLLQIIRETASNCARHSQARSLQIVLQREHEFAKLEISDDGVGLTPSAEPGPGRGLANLADRSKELGGTLQIDSAPGQGLRVQLTFACPGSRPPHPQASATARATT
jgi:signal transduction histidine kinase